MQESGRLAQQCGLFGPHMADTGFLARLNQHDAMMVSEIAMTGLTLIACRTFSAWRQKDLNHVTFRAHLDLLCGCPQSSGCHFCTAVCTKIDQFEHQPVTQGGG